MNEKEKATLQEKGKVDYSKPVVCMGEGPDFTHPKLNRRLKEGEVFIDLEGKDLEYIKETVELKTRFLDEFFGDLRLLDEMEVFDFKMRGIITQEELSREFEKRGLGNIEQMKRDAAAIAGMTPEQLSKELSQIKTPDWIKKRNWETFIPLPPGRVVEANYEKGYLIVEKEPPKPIMEEKFVKELVSRPLAMIRRKPHAFLDTLRNPYLYRGVDTEELEKKVAGGEVRERVVTPEGVNLILGSAWKREIIPMRLWRIFHARVEMDARPTGSGKTREATIRLMSYNVSKEDEWTNRCMIDEGYLLDKPILSANLYVAPNLSTKGRVFAEIKENSLILKGKDSRIFKEITPPVRKKAGSAGRRRKKRGSGEGAEQTLSAEQVSTDNQQKVNQVDWIYRKLEKGGKPILAGVLGKNTMFYSFLLAKKLRELRIPHKINITLDDFVPNLAMTLVPVLRKGEGGEEEFATDYWTDYYHQNVMLRFLKGIRDEPEKIEKYFNRELPGIDGLDDEAFEVVRRMVWHAQTYLLSCEEPFYIREPVRSGYCFSPEKIQLIFTDRLEPVVNSPEEFWATVNLLEWLVLSGRKLQLITPNKPRAQRALSSEEEFGAETLFRLIAYLQLLVMYREVGWVREVIGEVIQKKKPVVLSDVQANALVAMSMVASGMDVYITDGTATLSGGGFIYHNRAGYVLVPETTESGKFLRWRHQGFYNEDEVNSPVKDEWINVDSAFCPYPVIQGGVKTFVRRTGLQVKRARFTLGKSTIEPLMSINRIIVPEMRGEDDGDPSKWKLQPNVYVDLLNRYEVLQRGGAFGSFKKLKEMVRESSSLSLVRNLHVIARSRRILQDYDKRTKVAQLEEEVKREMGQDEKFELLSIYATIFLAELLRRYAYFDGGDPSRVRVVLDPRILNMVSRTPVKWVENEELKEDFATISRFLPGMISQANRGRTDKVVTDSETAVVIWLTSVDPLYERSGHFKHFVALSEINQTLGRFVHRGEDTAKNIVLIFLGGGRSGFFLKSIASLFDFLHICNLDWEKVYMIEADRVGKELVDELFHYEDPPPGSRVIKLLGKRDDEVIEEVMREREQQQKRESEEVQVKEARKDNSGSERLFSDKFHDPHFDDDLYIITKEDLERAKRAERYKKQQEEEDRKAGERRRERALVENLKYTLSEEFGLETSISDPKALRKLIEQLHDTGRVPNWALDKVWKTIPEEHNPYLDGWSEE